MYRFTKSVVINRSQEDVFNYISNATKMPEWQSSVETAEWTSNGTPGVHSTYKVLVKMPGGKSESTFEVTDWDPPNRYGYKSVKLSIPGSIKSSYRLAPNESGTYLTFEAQLEATGLFKLVEGMLGKMAEKGDGGSIEALKQLLEAE